MKLIVCLLLLHMAVALNAQTPVISSTRFGNLKLGFTVDSINKYLDHKIKLKKPNPDIFDWDTVHATYKGVPVRLVIDHRILNGTNSFQLYSIYTESTEVATRSGIRAGQNKFDVIRKLDGSVLYIRPEPDLGKNISTVILDDLENFTQVCFYFRDNVLYAIEIITAEEGC